MTYQQILYSAKCELFAHFKLSEMLVHRGRKVLAENSCAKIKQVAGAVLASPRGTGSQIESGELIVQTQVFLLIEQKTCFPTVLPSVFDLHRHEVSIKQ